MFQYKVFVVTIPYHTTLYTISDGLIQLFHVNITNINEIIDVKESNHRVLPGGLWVNGQKT